MTLSIIVAIILVVQIGISACVIYITHTINELTSAVKMLGDISNSQFETDQKQRERLEKLEADLNHLAEVSGQRLGNLENKVTLLERSIRND